tara:strand:- start:439 stop:942 length:504 start_codon:yes stop_codon:yes gene_type:complete
MTWFNILKFYGPRDFMTDLQEMLGGEYHGGSNKKVRGYSPQTTKTSFNYYLQHRDGNIKLETMRDGKFIIRVNGEIVAREYSLKKALEIVKEHLSNIKKSSKIPEGTTHIMVSEHYENADGNKEWSVYFADDDMFEIETIDGFYSKEHAYDFAIDLGKKLKLEVHEE